MCLIPSRSSRRGDAALLVCLDKNALAVSVDSDGVCNIRLGVSEAVHGTLI